MRPIVLDAGFFIALERGDRHVLAVAKAIKDYRIPAFTSASVVAQVWRGSPKQHDLGVLLKSGAIRVEPITENTAREIGVILGETNTSDVTDAHVVLIAQRLNAIVYTSDDGDINAIDATLRVEHV